MILSHLISKLFCLPEIGRSRRNAILQLITVPATAKTHAKWRLSFPTVIILLYTGCLINRFSTFQAPVEYLPIQMGDTVWCCCCLRVYHTYKKFQFFMLENSRTTNYYQSLSVEGRGKLKKLWSLGGGGYWEGQIWAGVVPLLWGVRRCWKDIIAC